MKIIKPSAEILRPELTQEAIDAIYRNIEIAGRTCYKSEDKITPDSARKFVRALIKSGHEAMIEHASMTIRFIVDRGVSHELVRHRLASWAQESQRYCIAGNVKLTFSDPHNKKTIEELYNNKINSKNGAWKKMKIRQYNEDTGELSFAKIKDVYYNGEKECIQIKTKLGYELICTKDHRILTPQGYLEANSLSLHNKIYVNGTDALYTNYDWLYNQSITLNKTFVQIANEFNFNVSTVKKWAQKLCIPKKGRSYFQIGRTPWNKGVIDERQANALREYHHCGRRKEGLMKQDTKKYHKHVKQACELYGENTLLDVHHLDENRENNNPDNLITLCPSCHGRVHSKNLLTTYADEIVEIKEVGIQKVYDIEMASEYHNFAANGVIVHNCSYNKDKFNNEITFIKPSFFEENTPEYEVWLKQMQEAEDAYLTLLQMNRTPQEARSVLPNSTKTEVVMTANMREMRHFFKLRAAGTTGAPHPQMYEVAMPLLRQCQELMPEIFGDIEIN